MSDLKKEDLDSYNSVSFSLNICLCLNNQIGDVEQNISAVLARIQNINV